MFGYNDPLTCCSTIIDIRHFWKQKIDFKKNHRISISYDKNEINQVYFKKIDGKIKKEIIHTYLLNLDTINLLVPTELDKNGWCNSICDIECFPAYQYHYETFYGGSCDARLQTFKLPDPYKKWKLPTIVIVVNGYSKIIVTPIIVTPDEEYCRSNELRNVHWIARYQ